MLGIPIGENYFDVYPINEEQKRRDLHYNLIQKKKTSFIDYAAHIVDGEQRFFKTIIQSIIGINDKIVELIFITIDITDEVKARNKMKETLEMQNQMFSTISHELKTPLSVIFSASQLMELDLRDEIEPMISTVEKTIAHNKGEVKMSNKEKFEGFKKERLTENESKFGEEIREKYGEENVIDSNQRFMNMSKDEFKNMQNTENKMFESLKEVDKTKDLESEAAKNVYENHKAWLNFTWTSYSLESHIRLAEMYVEDERFSNYYNDRAGIEVVTVLRDIIIKYAK